MGGKEKSLFQAAKVYHRIAVCNALAAVRAGEQVQVQIADIVRIHQKCQLYGCAFAGGEVGEIVFLGIPVGAEAEHAVVRHQLVGGVVGDALARCRVKRLVGHGALVCDLEQLGEDGDLLILAAVVGAAECHPQYLLLDVLLLDDLIQGVDTVAQLYQTAHRGDLAVCVQIAL